MSWQDPERFEIVGVRLFMNDNPIGYVVTLPIIGKVEIVVAHYETHLDARLGAMGLRKLHFEVENVKDRETDSYLHANPVSPLEIGAKLP